MRGSLVVDPNSTGPKNRSGVTLSTPSATPVVLSYVTSRPFTNTTNCEGPTAPMPSGGYANVGWMPASVAPRKLTPTLWGAAGVAPRAGVMRAVPFTITGAFGESG